MEYLNLALFSLCISLTILSSRGLCQKGNPGKIKTVDVNIVPGFGTSGLDHDRRNYISLNIFSGYSDQTYLFQLSGISGTNRTYSGGLHLAGFGNFTGMNLKSMDPEDYETEVIPYIHLHGLQFAGVINLVRGGIVGGQVAGMFNISQKELIGAQMAGLFNFLRFRNSICGPE